jgi:hypothetical protein
VRGSVATTPLIYIVNVFNVLLLPSVIGIGTASYWPDESVPSTGRLHNGYMTHVYTNVKVEFRTDMK